LKAEYDVVIAGAGLGGLTAGALLSKKGYSTLVIEKLPRIGGRFANIPHKGFQLSTGAMHLIPHSRGVVKRLFRDELRTDLEFIETGSIPLMSEDAMIQYVCKFPKALDSVFRFSLGLKFRETPIVETIRFMIKSLTAGSPCVPKGGCGGVIQALEKTILDNRGEIAKQASLSGIEIQHRNVTAIKTRRGNDSISTVETSQLISDIGPKNTLKTLPTGTLKEGFQRRLGKIAPAEGIKISIESSRPVLNEIAGEEVGVIFTPSCNRIAGIAEPSFMDPDLAPSGKSLLMAAQGILSSNIKDEVQLGIADLKRIIPNFRKNCHVLAVQVFKGEWPVNYARQGQDAPQITPINGLYLVGDGAKPSGFIMAEGVVESARRVVEHILRE